MGTRTAIFQEQSNGQFLGIYIHYDGYIEGVGNTLLDHYGSRKKTFELLNKKRFLSCLGNTTEFISFEEQMEMYSNNNKDIENYCVAHNDEEYFLAESLEDIRTMQYLTYCNGEIDGFYATDEEEGTEFIEFRGSDNNGFLYYQDLNGCWHVSRSIAKETYHDRMSAFEPLDTLL